MSPHKLMLTEFPWSEQYRISHSENVLTPALVIYPELVASNIACTLSLLAGDASRWRAHVKTAKLGFSMRMLVESGVRNFKCATTLELLVACENGATDVLLAYPVVGANAQRARAIASQFPGVRVSVLAESEAQVRQWRGSAVSIFLDINPGMNRTGIGQEEHEKIIALTREIHGAHLEFRGIHYYDGQYGALDPDARTAAAHSGYDRLLDLIARIRANKVDVPEAITAGTPTLPCSLSYPHFVNAGFVHRVSPGTVIYNDATSLAQLPREYGYAPAALVLTRVVSQPDRDTVTCDAGHKSVSADAGIPTCVVMGNAGFEPLSPSEEHLPIRVRGNSPPPNIGKELFLLPRHICPTVNNFDRALLVKDGRVESVEEVSARGREGPMLLDREIGDPLATSARIHP